MNRRTFVKDAALAAVAGSGLPGGLGALSGLLAQPRQDRPFNMICLGDSVMWGQGLEESTKFTSLVKSWLERMLPGRSVNRLVYARSGATIGPDGEIPDASHVKAWMNDPTLGEVPCSWPWVQQQVAVARADLAGRRIGANFVDLVLLDGGANDLGITTFLNAGKSTDEIRNKSAEFCGTQMTDLLGRVRSTFPSAKILVTGYYPIVSVETDLLALAVLLSILLPGVGGALTVAIRSKLTALSDAWYEASNDDLAGAVASINARASVSSGTPAAAFARVPWGAMYSYAASNPRLWLAGLPNDPVYWQRQRACAAAGPGKMGNPLCLDAKIGHPNPSGAAAYAAACQDQLAQYLPGWGAKLMTVCVEMDPMPAAGVPTTLTVHATADKPGGPGPIPATVRVAGQTFPTGTPVPVTLCNGGPAGCVPITVSSAGYVDVIIRDYLNAQPLPL